MKKNKNTKSTKAKRSASPRGQSSGLADIRENVVETITEGFDRVGSEFTRATRSTSVRNAAWVVGGAAAGVALAYFLDPAAGSDRRSLITGKMGSLKQGISDVTGERLNGWRGSVREFVAKGLSAVKANFMDGRAESDLSEDEELDTDSVTPSRKSSKNYNNYQENTYSEQ